MAVLSPGAIPTVDFYLTPRLSGLAESAFLRFDSRQTDAPASLPHGTFVVIVRHAGRAWLDALVRQRERLAGVAFLMDDDIPAAWRCKDVPLDYGLWTSGRYWRVRHLLARVCDRIWVSTEALQQRYPNSRVVPPLAFTAARPPAPVGTRRWGYHGTRIHGRELKWLVPVVAEVQRVVATTEFEIIGGPRIARLFVGIPRVRVLPVMPWPEYVTHCHNSNLAVGVAPLLPGRFNAVRSCIKVFDIARCGAVGVYSAREPYAPTLYAAGAALLPDEPSAWVAEIVRLLENDDLRCERYRATLNWIEQANSSMDIAGLIET